ncbi:type IV pilin [Haloarchaeobius sp. DFWS5]|uniref:type IV pilin n=1 Tax=Haloarchaeobius sp. DFWS5 TaxID=3446114 RepID=UPI003EBBF293
MFSSRAVSPVLGTVLVLALTVTLAGVVALSVFDEQQPAEPVQARFELTADASSGRITVTHMGGNTVDVTELRVVVSVDGTRLDHQPPVPFFSATGFAPGPTGPFNSATDSRWSAGESASVGIAGTNRPTLAVGSRVVVSFYREDVLLGRVETVVRTQASTVSSSVSTASASSTASSVDGDRATVTMAMSGS